MYTNNHLVEIKGQKDSLWIYLSDQGSIEDVFSALNQRLEASHDFFSGADVLINPGTRLLSEADETAVRKIVEQGYHLHITQFLAPEPQPAPSEESLPISQENCLEENHEESSSGESIEPALPSEFQAHSAPELSVEAPKSAEGDSEQNNDAFMKYLDDTFQIPIQHTWEVQKTYSSDHLYKDEETAFYFRGTVRSGQSLEYPGNIVILGDVNSGAYVLASGDIIVMGRLHGVVHAGAEGEERAVVIGAHFNPSQLRIAQYIGRPPDDFPGGRKRSIQTEKAYVKDGIIVIEPIL